MTKRENKGRESEKAKARDPGQPTKYRTEFNELAYKACLVGATDKDLAEKLGVSESTLNNWKHKYPKFLESIHSGKQIADGNVAFAAYNRAIGYDHEITTESLVGGEIVSITERKHYPADPQTIRLWLSNRRPEQWRERKEIDVKTPLADKSLEEIRAHRKQLERQIAALTQDADNDDD